MFYQVDADNVLRRSVSRQSCLRVCFVWKYYRYTQINEDRGANQAISIILRSIWITDISNGGTDQERLGKVEAYKTQAWYHGHEKWPAETS